MRSFAASLRLPRHTRSLMDRSRRVRHSPSGLVRYDADDEIDKIVALGGLVTLEGCVGNGST
jgi:hypothetical protein